MSKEEFKQYFVSKYGKKAYDELLFCIQNEYKIIIIAKAFEVHRSTVYRWMQKGDMWKWYKW